jgi:hypothetical protein
MVAWIALAVALVAFMQGRLEAARRQKDKFTIHLADLAGEHIAEVKRTAENGELLKHPDTVRAEMAEAEVERLSTENVRLFAKHRVATCGIWDLAPVSTGP